MNKILHIAVREFVETTKTKVFLFSVFVTPLLIGGIMFFMNLMKDKIQNDERPPVQFTVLDQSGALQADLKQVFDQYNAAHPKRIIEPVFQPVETEEGQEERLKVRIRKGELMGCLVIPADALSEAAPSHYYMKTKKISDMEVFRVARGLVNDAAVQWRVRQSNIPPEVVAEIRRPLPVVQVDVTDSEEQQGPQAARLMTPFFFLFLMFMGVFGTSQGMLTSVIEEKGSRVIEVLLSAVSPFQLMAGKIAGLGAIGLSVVTLWGAAACAAALYQGMGDLISLAGLGYFLVYFVLGFLLFSSTYAAIGAACNTLKEAQAMVTPVMIIIMVPMMAWFYISQYPEGFVAVLLSYIPFTAPMVMILRIAAWPEIPLFQIVSSIAVLALSVPLVMWAAAKVFRTGILMYGKPPTLRELLRWVRQG